MDNARLTSRSPDTPSAAPGNGSKLDLGTRRRRMVVERLSCMRFLFACAALSVLTTVGIVVTLLGETIQFFGEVPVLDFLTGTRWTPLFASQHFGVLPLVNGTLAVAVVALAVAVSIGLLTAVFLSEYAPPAPSRRDQAGA